MTKPDHLPAVRVLNMDGRSPLLIVCDHASNEVPPELNGLGLGAAERHQHIAFDIGARALAEILCWRCDAPLVAACWSRLVVDLNRYPDDASLIPAVSDGVTVPANLRVDAAERTRRLDAYFHPYHDELGRVLDEMIARHQEPNVFLVHTFTPFMNGTERPWHLGILYEEHRALSDAFIKALGPDPGFTLGRNEPYDASEPKGYTMFEQVVRRKLPYVCIEVRQDLLADAKGVSAWADRLQPALQRVIQANQS